MKRAAILCPGRGSYTERTLRSLPDDHAWIARAEELRDQRNLPSLVALDRAPRFRPQQHLLPSNVSPLIYLITMLDAAQAKSEHEVVVVLGNSMGWYTALAVAGALSFDDGFRLVQEMSVLQEEHGGGGQVLYPKIGEDWRAEATLEEHIRAALASSEGEAFRSIELGGYAVLAGSEQGVAHMLRALPPIRLGQNSYPFRLVQHGPYHTPLVEPVATRAREFLADLEFRPPSLTLVDGRGVRFTPWSSDPAALADYTLGAQIVTPYDFTASVRVALREHAPERLVLPGPGNTLGGVSGQILVAEGWRGIHTREDFERVQEGTDPLVISMRR